eukprot:CAMPEP_0113904380 /NCGR_PEP_ID=MMETSP0780_2-20120614/23206_1 /TAXON_ID=652834 /ORGANISM="Palpitomonas bilix" /LENGTH=116 /DNA_ID=CAMNT_0000897955 /DNA_START=44 /DNA_END=391 /DNA_ORIENTATION=+ /assembly_acc=CAM_ASM_000599
MTLAGTKLVPLIVLDDTLAEQRKWMEDKDVVIDVYLERVFKPYVRQKMDGNSKRLEAMLVWTGGPCHKCPDVMNSILEYPVSMHYLPAGSGDDLPLDVGIKRMMRAALVRKTGSRV